MSGQHDRQKAPAGPAAPAPSRAARTDARTGLYVHVPFCARRCSYCDFATGSLTPHGVERYLAAIDLEAVRRAPMAAGVRFSSVFFGGGTPSALDPRAFRALWHSIQSRFAIAADAEITLEANPESALPERVEAWRSAGVNRVSLGVQSFVPEELELLGRIHSADRPARAVAHLRAAGIRRVSLDLMYGFPGHRLERWQLSVEQALALEVEHASLYCFIAEPGTALGDAVHSRRRSLPADGAQARLHDWAVRRMVGAGFVPYETANFCRPGGEARHNLVYWLGRPYVGLGPSAHGSWSGVRYGNHRSFSRWATALERAEDCEAMRERTDDDTRALEILMLALRLGSGLSREDHGPDVWQRLIERWGEALDLAVLAGRLERHSSGWSIAERHRFVADDIIAWVSARPRKGSPRGATLAGRRGVALTSVS